MLTRRIGKFLRGKATPFQIFAATLLGSWIGFAPGFSRAPGLVVALALLLLLLNANLGVALAVGALAKLASLALLPISFEVGRFLLDGPTAPLFRAMANAPVLAYFGLERYATSGGLVLGLGFGLLLGFLLSGMLSSFRRKLAGLEEGSERYKKLVAKRWVRTARFIFVGGGGKKSYGDLLQKRVGNPVRIPGLVLVLVVAGGVYFLKDWIATPVLTRSVKSGLERANGATVDLSSVELDLSEGRLTITDLAMADPNALETDLLRAEVLEADVAGADLLRRRLAIDSLVIRNAKSGAMRATPGGRVGPKPEPTPEDELDLGEGERTLEDYIRDFKTWKGRLAQARQWVDRLAKVRGADENEPEASEGVPGETLEERLQRLARELGYAEVTADHLVVDAPTLRIGELRIEGLELMQLEGEVLDVKALNLSTHPHLVDGAPRIEIGSRSDNLALKLGLDQVSSDPDANRLYFHWRGISTDEVAGSLQVAGEPPVQGGTIDLALDGSWSAGRVGALDLPLRVDLFDATIAVPGHGSTQVEHFTLPIGLRGPLDNPRIRIDDDELVDALVAAGADKLASELKSRAAEELDKVQDELGEKIGDKLGEELGDKLDDDLKEKAGGLLDGFRKKKD